MDFHEEAFVLSARSHGDTGAVVDLPTLTEKDISDLKNFGVAYQVDFIAASFVRKGSDIDFIRMQDRFVLKCNHDSGSAIVCNY